MYTLLLVDDEEDVIEVIERKVSWEQIGFHVVGHAGNGFKALEMMEDMQPDVVMTDIRMPYMDDLSCAVTSGRGFLRRSYCYSQDLTILSMQRRQYISR